MPDISDEKLREILAGCEGVTPGPYGAGDSGFIYDPNGRVVADMGLSSDKNTDHFTRLDPQTVASIVTELLSHRARLAYRHSELIEAISSTKEPAHGNINHSIPSFTSGDTCGHCGMHHSGPCPRIKAVEYYPDGTVKRIEYHEPKPIIGGSNA